MVGVFYLIFFYSSGKWQAMRWFGFAPICISSGTCVRHLSCAFQQRVLKTQPDGGLIGLGRSPVKMMRSRVRSDLGSGRGTADKSAVV